MHEPAALDSTLGVYCQASRP